MKAETGKAIIGLFIIVLAAWKIIELIKLAAIYIRGG